VNFLKTLFIKILTTRTVSLLAQKTILIHLVKMKVTQTLQIVTT